MAIKKQEFYEGAALHLLVRTGSLTTIQYVAPFLLLNERLCAYLKYSTRGRSPWGFTFNPEEQAYLENRASKLDIVIGLICGADGVAAVPYEAYRRVAAPRSSALRIACYRQHGEHYEVKGPDGILDRKVAPSNWLRLLER